jgi:hypothetical protein
MVPTLFFNLSLTSFFVIRRLYNSRYPLKIPFYLIRPIVFSLGHTKVSHDNRNMNICADLSKFQNSEFFMSKCRLLLNPVLVGVDGNLHFKVPPSTKRLNKIKPANLLGFFLGGGVIKGLRFLDFR